MNERIQAEPPRPNPLSDGQEYEAVNFRKLQGGVPAWVWVIIVLALLLVLGCIALAGVGFLVYRTSGV